MTQHISCSLTVRPDPFTGMMYPKYCSRMPGDAASCWRSLRNSAALALLGGRTKRRISDKMAIASELWNLNAVWDGMADTQGGSSCLKYVQIYIFSKSNGKAGEIKGCLTD